MKTSVLASTSLILGCTLTMLVSSCGAAKHPGVSSKPATVAGSPFTPATSSASTPDSAAHDEARLARVRALVAALGDDRSAGFYLTDDGQFVVQVMDERASTQVRSANIANVVPRVVTRSTSDLRSAQSRVRRLGRIVGTSYGIDESANCVAVEADDGVSAADYARLRDLARRSRGAITLRRINGRITTR